MQFLIFAITYPIIWILSLLPMRVLYILSDFLYILFFFLIGYRKKVVLENLQLAFPTKDLSELKTIQKDFFKHFTDIFVESIKAFSITKKTLLKRYKFTNPELINELYDKGRSIAFMGAHQANWEWSVNSPLVINSKVYGAYTSLGNTYFDKVVKKSRERFGFKCYESSKTTKVILKNFKEKKQSIYLLLSDQSPQVERSLYWTDFFGIKVPIHVGA